MKLKDLTPLTFNQLKNLGWMNKGDKYFKLYDDTSYQQFINWLDTNGQYDIDITRCHHVSRIYDLGIKYNIKFIRDTYSGRIYPEILFQEYTKLCPKDL